MKYGLGKSKENFKKNEEAIAKLIQELEELHKKIGISDIDATCQLVDPSGQISKYLMMLQEKINNGISSEFDRNDIRAQKLSCDTK